MLNNKTLDKADNTKENKNINKELKFFYYLKCKNNNNINYHKFIIRLLDEYKSLNIDNSSQQNIKTLKNQYSIYRGDFIVDEKEFLKEAKITSQNLITHFEFIISKAPTFFQYQEFNLNYIKVNLKH